MLAHHLAPVNVLTISKKDNLAKCITWHESIFKRIKQFSARIFLALQTTIA